MPLHTSHPRFGVPNAVYSNRGAIRTDGWNWSMGSPGSLHSSQSLDGRRYGSDESCREYLRMPASEWELSERTPRDLDRYGIRSFMSGTRRSRKYSDETSRANDS